MNYEIFTEIKIRDFYIIIRILMKETFICIESLAKMY